MIINKPIKTTGESIDYLNKAVFGEDPDYTVLSRVYESSIPIQDRVNDLETNRVNEATVEALQAKVESLEALTTMFANLAYPVPNLVANGDLTLDTNADNIPDGFNKVGGYIPILNNGIYSFTALSSFNGIYQTYNYKNGNQYYIASKVKASSNLVRLGLLNMPPISHSGSGNWELLSNVQNVSTNTVTRIDVFDARSSGWTQVQIDFLYVFNVSTMKLKGVKDDNGTPFTLLTNTQIKTQLDLWMATQFPLEVLLQMNS